MDFVIIFLGKTGGAFMKIKTLLLVLVILSAYSSTANAATYRYYFSNNAAGNPTGSDTIGNGSQSAPWKTLAKAQAAINALSSSDTAYLYFDRGDIWSANTAQISTASTYGLLVISSNPTVHIDAYGTGNNPIFDGQVTNFSAVPSHNASTGPLFYNRFVSFEDKNGCSIQNLEIRNCYGIAVFMKNAHSITISKCYLHNLGYSAVNINGTFGLRDSTFSYNIVHTAQELYRNSKFTGWAGGVNFHSDGTGVTANNHIHHNIVYDIYGEGIVPGNAVTEYNVVGDTGSVAIDQTAFRADYGTSIARYNYVVHSDFASSIYDGHPGGMKACFRVYDESAGGNNASGTQEIYGNICIGRQYGIRGFCTGTGNECNPIGTVRIYNNTFIDNAVANMEFKNAGSGVAKNLYVYNNASILYGKTSAKHILDDATVPYVTWHQSNNAFWTTGGSPVVDSDWRTNYVTTDPQLPGEPSIDWDGQTGVNYYLNIDLREHLYPSSASPLFGKGLNLGSMFNNRFLSAGTKFDINPVKSSFVSVEIPAGSPWHIGAIAPSGEAQESPVYPIPPPSGVTIDIK